MENLKKLVEDFNNTSDLEERISIATKYNEHLLKNIEFLEHPKDLPIPNTEVWKNVIGYVGVYQISNLGNLKSLERFFIKNRRGGLNKMAVYQPEKVRTIRYHKFGYPQIALWLNNKVKHVSIHRLIAIHFIPNPNNFPQVLHKDDNPSNSCWLNLEWGTQSKNIQDAADRGRGFRGSMNGMAKLKEVDIPKIRIMIAQGISARIIGGKFGVAHGQILQIKHNRIWKHVK